MKQAAIIVLLFVCSVAATADTLKGVVQNSTSNKPSAGDDVTLKKIGNDAKLTIYTEAQHDSWTETYNNQQLYDWFLQHDRPNAGKKPQKK